MKKGKESKPHIGIFGKRNAGKSSFINCITDQDIAIVSELAGTTTDPVKKTIEIKEIGPVILIDTAGIDDTGILGQKRIKKTLDTINIIDLAILIISENNFDQYEIQLIDKFKILETPFLIIHNKTDKQTLLPELKLKIETNYQTTIINFSTKIPELSGVLEAIKNSLPETSYINTTMLGDLVSQGDIVLLITPIDSEAPEGRLILPQVQTIRDILDNDCVAIVLKEREVDAFLKNTAIVPKLVITDSQLFLKADAMIPKNIPLTGFSVLLAKTKGDFENYLKGTPHINKLKDGDKILLLESCTHQTSCDDIGRVKIPRWLNNYTGKNLEFEIVAGLSTLKNPITDYAMVIQCGACMITRKQLINRLKPAVAAGVPVSNYGLTIAFVQGIYERATAPFLHNTNNSANYL